VAHALIAERSEVAGEVAAAHVAWPLIDRGIPHPQSPPRHPASRGPVHSARSRRQAALRARREAALHARREAALARKLAEMRRAVVAATARGQALSQPLIAHAEELTGAGSGIAAVYELGTGLISHGWPQVEAALQAGRRTPAQARAFLRANVNTYIVSVYDGNFDLGLLGRALERAYGHLGGRRAFGEMLTPREVAEIKAAYSPAREQLRPHPWQGLVSS
jgi:hypothetical protein